MLEMKCPKCKELIASALLSEVDSIHCTHCKEQVAVDNIMVSAEGFTFHRSDLIKRLFRYKTLLKEVGKERAMLEQSPNASAESKKSLDRFLTALEEVMAGARNNLRLDFTDPVAVSCSSGGQTLTGVLANLSMTGARIKIDDRQVAPGKRSLLLLEFSLPGLDYPFKLEGAVSWLDGNREVGVEFKRIDQDALEVLWTFITSSVDEN